ELRVDSQSNCKDIRHQTEAKISKIERKIDELERMREALLKLVKACRENTTTGECPILEALEG
ncbi:MAG: heavy metal-responsive transcriptional regulator, partial [candidate division Zixibacteria bacterium]|nr:heavy metal-responsive transcriptional regulator [candidate division KSB1 bacterium]NIV07320.1 heavy metal-responsive transcriptional regulator [candidate division Zixibacteria bacterium]NIS23072.1 heavy metal-responsive transcriptional regulator [candidate division KSB1 bacterium]NIU23573.1 heavy metal-responsive transcriptional regulator [candidate division KSB1 bacterium]NIV93570.1 heavy metal-responsive transcriptional regulator [candidate division KSB1 bacterium]